MMMFELLGAADFTWDPGFKGLLTVAVAVIILCGSVALIVGTNSGARLGFLIALTGLFGWFFVMGIVWATYGIGYIGESPTWQVIDVTTGDPGTSRVPVADALLEPTDLPDPVEVRDDDPDLLAEFPQEARDPALGDLVTVDTDLEDAINDQVGPWKILATSNGYSGETQAAVAEALGPDDQAIFTGPDDYMVLEGFVTGGKTGRTDDSIVSRVIYKFTSALEFDNDPFYAAVQLQPVIPQEAAPGEAPPAPVVNEDAPVYTVVLERDRGTRRLPSTLFTVTSGLLFAVCASALHRRDKLAQTQRAATAGAGA